MWATLPNLDAVIEANEKALFDICQAMEVPPKHLPSVDLPQNLSIFGPHNLYDLAILPKEDTAIVGELETSTIPSPSLSTLPLGTHWYARGRRPQELW